MPEPIRPYSPQYWRERQRRFRAESERRRRFWRVVAAAVAAAAIAAAFLIAVSHVPDDWERRLRETGVHWAGDRP